MAYNPDSWQLPWQYVGYDYPAWGAEYNVISDSGTQDRQPPESTATGTDPSRQSSSDVQSPYDAPTAIADANEAPSRSPSPVKVEQDEPDGRFIMELTAYRPNRRSSSTSPLSSPGLNTLDFGAGQSHAPPAEVPLRATQASKEMRRMMGVFRLNPFAMHSLSVGSDDGPSIGPQETSAPSWCGEPGPLEEEPVILEFQLNIPGLSPSSDDPESIPATDPPLEESIPEIDETHLRPFSPSFELPSDGIDEPRYPDLESHHSRNCGQIEEQPPQVTSSNADNQSIHSDNDDGRSTAQLIQTPEHDFGVLQGASDPLYYPHLYSQHHPHLDVSPPLAPSSWNDVTNGEHYTPQGVATIPVPPMKAQAAHPRSSRPHAEVSHPYLRKGRLVQQKVAASSSSLHSPIAYMRHPQIPRESMPSPDQARLLLNTPTHHSQPFLRRHATVDEEYFSSYRPTPLQHPEAEVNAMYAPRTRTSPPPMAATSLHERRQRFSQPSTSYMRAPEVYTGQYVVQEPPCVSQTSQSRQIIQPLLSPPHLQQAGYPPQMHAQQPFGAPVAGPSGSNRRWSLPDTSGRYSQGPFFG